MNCIATCCYLFLQNAFHPIITFLYTSLCTLLSLTPFIFIYLCALFSLTASDDFAAQTNVPVTFDPTSAWQTVDVQIVNDNILESTEYFVGVITSSSMQRGVLLGQSTMSVNLVDDDSELSLSFYFVCVFFSSYKSSLTSTATFEDT